MIPRFITPGSFVTACAPSCIASPTFRVFSTTPATPELYTLSLHDALPILDARGGPGASGAPPAHLLGAPVQPRQRHRDPLRSEEHTSELQSRGHLVCRLLLEKKKNIK